MVRVIKLKKGLNLCIEGEAVPGNDKLVTSGEIAVVPDNYVGLLPKVTVRPGDKVKAGSPLMHDKNHETVQVVSPVSGEVVAVERGERRKVLKIVVKNDGAGERVDFGIQDADRMAPEALRGLLQAAGLWVYIKQRPYDIIADPDVAPRDIFVTAFDNAPLAPRHAYDLLWSDDNTALQAGLKALARLTQGKVYVDIDEEAHATRLPDCVEPVVFKGAFPSCNAGVQLHHIAPVNKGETVWTLCALDVVFIGRLLLTGSIDLTRTVALCGSEVAHPTYVKACPGTPVADMVGDNLVPAQHHRRFISGNVLTGLHIPSDGYLDAYHSQITVIPEGDETHDFLGWAMPGLRALSLSRTFLSRWLPCRCENKPDARIHGGERAIIMSGEYDKVFPMDILPEYLIKAIIAFDIDRMEQLGIYEVAPEDFAACEFVDTSKLPLQQIVRNGLDLLRKEMC